MTELIFHNMITVQQSLWLIDLFDSAENVSIQVTTFGLLWIHSIQQVTISLLFSYFDFFAAHENHPNRNKKAADPMPFCHNKREEKRHDFSIYSTIHNCNECETIHWISYHLTNRDSNRWKMFYRMRNESVKNIIKISKLCAAFDSRVFCLIDDFKIFDEFSHSQFRWNLRNIDIIILCYSQ